ncbi:MAG: helix-turn-helix transcriptional regulator [Alphaproteobacteria bacterium]|nr:helix-turn-helix transcriptional regulator [Alphaproteobacteria bacterium]
MRRKTDPTRAVDKHVGKQLRVMRAARGLTQEDLSEKLGISYQQLHKYETGANSIAASRLYEIAKLLGVSPDTFFDGLQPTANIGVPSENLLSREQVVLLKHLNNLPDARRSAVVSFIRSITA